MNLRQQLEIHQFHQEQEQEQLAAREAAEKPLRDAEAALQSTARQLYTTLRDIALTEPLDSYETDALAGIPRSTDNHGSPAALESSRAWATKEPRYTRLAEDQRIEVGQLLHDFVKRNELDPLSEQSWKRAFEILVYIGAVPVATEAEIYPEPEQVTAQPEVDPTEAERQRREEYHTKIVAHYAGKGYTAYDLDHTVADDYLRILGVRRFSGILAPEVRH